MTYEEWKKNKLAGKSTKINTGFAPQPYSPTEPMKKEEEEEKGFFSKYVEPVGRTALNIGTGLGDLAQTVPLYLGSKLGEALGGKEIMSNEQALKNVSSVFQPWKKERPKTFSTAINEDTNMPNYLKMPLGMVAEVGLDPTTYLGGGFGVGAKLAKTGKIGKAAKLADKSIDSAKLAKQISNWTKATKPISKLDKLATGGLLLKGGADVMEGNLLQGAVELGLGSLGQKGLRDQDELYKSLKKYGVQLEDLAPTKTHKFLKTDITPAKTIKGADQLMLSAPKTTDYVPDFTMVEPHGYKKPAFELMDEKLGQTTAKVDTNIKQLQGPSPDWTTPEVPVGFPTDKTPAIGYEAPAYKPYEAPRLEIPEVRKTTEIVEELPIKRFLKEDMPTSSKVNDKAIYEEFTPFNEWRNKENVLIGANKANFEMSKTGKAQRYWTNKDKVAEELTDHMAGGGKISDDLNWGQQMAGKSNRAAGRFEAREKDIRRAISDEAIKRNIDVKDLSDYTIAKHQLERQAREQRIIRATMPDGKEPAFIDQLGKEISEDPNIIRSERIIQKSLDDIAAMKNKYGSKIKDLDELAERTYAWQDKLTNENFLNNNMGAERYRKIKGLRDDVSLEVGSPAYERIKKSALSGEAGAPAIRADLKEFIDTEKTPFENYISLEKLMDDKGVLKKPAKNSLSFKEPEQGKLIGAASERESGNSIAQLLNQSARDIPRQENAMIANTLNKMFGHTSGALRDVAEKIDKKTYLYDPKIDQSKVLRLFDDNGVEQLWNIKNEDVAMSIFDIAPESATAFGKWLDGIAEAAQKHIAPRTRQMSKIYTSLKPSFLMPNTIKDNQQAALNLSQMLKEAKRNKGSYAKDLANGMKMVFDSKMGKDTIGAKEIDRLSKLGVFTNFLQFRTLEDMNKIVNKQFAKGKVDKKTLMKFVEATTAASENATRYAIFKKAVDSGMTDLKAANIAQEASLNFSKHGNGTVPKLLRALYAFSNPQLLDIERGIKTMADPAARAKLAFMYMAPATAIYEWNETVGGKDWREGIDQNTLNNNWVIKMPSSIGVDIKIPKPYFFNSVLALLDSADAVATGASTKEEAMENAINVSLSNMIPILGDRLNNQKKAGAYSTYAPTLIAPLAQLAENKNYWGSEIVPEYIKGKDAEKRYNTTRNGLIWDWLEENVLPGDVSPEVRKHLLRSYVPLGGETIDFLSIFEEANRLAAKGKDAKISDIVKKAPVIKRFVTEQNPNRNLEASIYNTRGEADKGIDIAAEVKALKNSLRTKRKEYDKDKDKYKSLMNTLDYSLRTSKKLNK